MMDFDLYTLTVILGLACVTVLARGFFLISKTSWNLPHWAQRGLQYAHCRIGCSGVARGGDDPRAFSEHLARCTPVCRGGGSGCLLLA